MHDLQAAGPWLQLLSGLAIVGLGVFVALLRPRTTTTRAFAVFAAGFGGVFVTVNAGTLFLDNPLPWSGPIPYLVCLIALYLAATAGLVGLALLFPAPLPRGQRTPLVIALVVVAPFVAWAVLAALMGATGSMVDRSGPAPILAALAFVAASVMVAALVGFHALLAVRATAAPDGASARRAALVAGALVLYSGFLVTSGGGNRAVSVFSADVGVAVWWGLASLALLCGAGVWLRAAATGPAPRAARNVALLTLFMMLLGLVYALFGLGTFGGHGIVRLAAVMVLAYAIVRHQLLGLDVKLRWTISKTTVAAVFVSVFFVTSEAAQEFFGAQAGSQYLGILAAGMLVFAIAPLARLADRIAEKAVPRASADAIAVAVPREHEEAYRRAVRLALRDHRLTRAEEADLFRLARVLGLEADRAHEILAEAEERQARPDRTAAE